MHTQSDLPFVSQQVQSVAFRHRQTMKFLRSVALALALAAGGEAFAPAASSWTRRPMVAPLQAVTAAQVKELREESGAGMMKCKEALNECDGDLTKAAEWLRAKGLASADKKSDRATTEGLISTYVHTGSKLGVMVEVNCETDFVSKGEKFAELCKGIAMQVAASPSVDFVRTEEIDDAVIAAERAAEMKSEDLAGKPDNIKEKMVEGRLGKILKQKVLMEQPYIKDPNMTVEDFVKGYISTLGENIQVARFVRFNLGETAAKDAAAEEEPAAEAPAPAAEAAPAKKEEKKETKKSDPTAEMLAALDKF